MPPAKRQRRAPAVAPAAPSSTTAFAISARVEAVALQTGYEEYALAHSRLRAWHYVVTNCSGVYDVGSGRKVAAEAIPSKVFADIDDNDMEEEHDAGKNLFVDKKYGIVWNDVDVIKRNLRETLEKPDED